MNHYLGYRGYALLYLSLVVGLSVFIMVIASILSALMQDNAVQEKAGILYVFAVFLSAVLTASRYLNVETARPTFYDVGQILLRITIYVSGFAFVIFVCALLVVLEMTGNVHKILDAKPLAGILAGVTGFLFVCYISLGLSFGLLSMMRKPKAELGES